MNLLFLHGPPASGKFTIGRELASLTGYRLFHNHLVVDAVLAVYDFGTPGFVALREEIWRTVFSRAAHDHLPGLIFTFAPEKTVRQEFIDWIFDELPRRSVTIHSIALAVDEAEIERRLASASRKNFGKITDLVLYRQLRNAGAFASPQIPRTELTLETATSPAVDSAHRIVRTFGLS